MYKGADRPDIKKFAREMSQIGGITLDRDAFADYFRSSNGKQLWVDKLSYIVTHLEKDQIPCVARLRKRCIRFVDALVPWSGAGIPCFLHRQ